MSTAQLEKIEKAWKPFSGVLCAPRSRSEYEQLVKFVDSLLDEIGEDEGHRLSSLLNLCGDLIHHYESGNVPHPDAL